MYQAALPDEPETVRRTPAARGEGGSNAAPADQWEEIGALQVTEGVVACEPTILQGGA